MIVAALLTFPSDNIAPMARAMGWILKDHARTCPVSEHLIQLKSQGFTGFRFVPGPQVRCVGPFTLFLTLPAQPGLAASEDGLPIWVAEDGSVSCRSKAFRALLSTKPSAIVAMLRQPTVTRQSNTRWKAYGEAVINGLAASWDAPTTKSFVPLAKARVLDAGWVVEWQGNPPMRFFNQLGGLTGDPAADSRYARLRDARCEITVDLSEKGPSFELP